VSNQFRLTKVVDFIPYGTHSNLFQMDVSDLFSPPKLLPAYRRLKSFQICRPTAGYNGCKMLLSGNLQRVSLKGANSANSAK
jgi:hypothetical protein